MDARMTVIQRCIGGQPAIIGARIPPHPNVAFCRIQGTCKYVHEGVNHSKDYSSIIKLNQTLASEDLGQYDERSTTIILCQLTHAVHHIHENGWAHGDIRLDNLMLTENRERVLLKHPTAALGQPATLDERNKDIEDMREVFHSIIENQRLIPSRISDPRYEENKTIEDDLMENVNTCRSILQHPFFWNTQKKISFLCAVARISKGNGRLKYAINRRSTEVFITRTWKEILEIIDTQEQDIYKNKLIDRIRRNGTVKKTQISEHYALYYYHYEFEELHSLVKFIRDRFEHFRDDCLEVQACFMFDPVDGLWNFFSRRFPKLFITVYLVMKQYAEQWADTGLEAEFFETLAENVDLVPNAQN